MKLALAPRAATPPSSAPPSDLPPSGSPPLNGNGSGGGLLLAAPRQLTASTSCTDLVPACTSAGAPPSALAVRTGHEVAAPVSAPHNEVAVAPPPTTIVHVHYPGSCASTTTDFAQASASHAPT